MSLHSLLFWLGIVLPTVIVFVVFLIFLLCWHRSREAAAAAAAAKKAGVTVMSRSSSTLSRKHRQQSHSSIRTYSDGRQSQNGGLFVMSYCHEDDNGHLTWDKYTVRDSMYAQFGALVEPEISIEQLKTDSTVHATTLRLQPPAPAKPAPKSVSQPDLRNQPLRKGALPAVPPPPPPPVPQRTTYRTRTLRAPPEPPPVLPPPPLLPPRQAPTLPVRFDLATSAIAPVPPLSVVLNMDPATSAATSEAAAAAEEGAVNFAFRSDSNWGLRNAAARSRASGSGSSSDSSQRELLARQINNSQTVITAQLHSEEGSPTTTNSTNVTSCTTTTTTTNVSVA